MTTKEKYELFDKTKINEKVLGILKNMQESSKNFTDESVNSKIDSALDKLIENFRANKPEALLTLPEAKKEVKKEKEKAIKKNKDKDLSEKKDTDDETGLPKKDTIEERKDIIKEESETEKEARDRAKKELEKENEKAKDEVESQIEKLNRIIMEDPALRGFNQGSSALGGKGLGGKSNPLIDAERKALPRGSRVSQKGWKNQYGASDGGRKYYENRENRTDRKSPDYETGKPYLAKGGNVYSSDEMYLIAMFKGDVDLDTISIRAKNKAEARMIFEDTYRDKYENELGDFAIEIYLVKPFPEIDSYASGGVIKAKKVSDWDWGKIFEKVNLGLGQSFVTILPKNPDGGKIKYGLIIRDASNQFDRSSNLSYIFDLDDKYYPNDRQDVKDTISSPYYGKDEYKEIARGSHFLVITIQGNRKTLLKDLIDKVNYTRFSKINRRNETDIPFDYPNRFLYDLLVFEGSISDLVDFVQKLQSAFQYEGAKLYTEPTPYIMSIIWNIPQIIHYDGSVITPATYIPIFELANEVEAKTSKKRKYADGGETGFGSWESLTIEKMQKDFPFDLNKLNRLLKDACENRDDADITNFQLSWMSKKYNTFAKLVYEAGIYLKSTGSDNVSPSGTYHSQKGLSIIFYLRQTYKSDGSMSSVSIDSKIIVAGGMGGYKSKDVENYYDIYNYISSVLRDNPKNNLGKFTYAEGGEVEGVDLFEDYDDQPEEVQAILANYEMEDNDYETLQNLKAELESIGYTMDFGLDAEPYDLRKIGQTGKSEFYAKGGEMADGGKLEEEISKIKSLGGDWQSYYKGAMAGKKDDGYVTIEDEADLNNYIYDKTGYIVKNIEVIEKGKNYPLNNSNPYFYDTYLVTLKNGSNFTFERSYGRPNWQGNVNYIERIKITNINTKHAKGDMFAEGGQVGDFFYDSRKDKAFQVIFEDGDKMGIQYLGMDKKPVGGVTTITKNEFEYNVEKGSWGKWKQEYAKGGEMPDGYMDDETLLHEFKETLMDTDDLQRSIKEYYVNAFPTDEEGFKIEPEANFAGLNMVLNEGDDVYEYLGVSDSLVRERVFEKLSEILGVDYDVVYNMWLNGDKYAKGGEMADGKLVQEIYLFDKNSYPKLETKGDKVRAIFDHFKKKGYSTDEINSALGNMKYADGGEMDDVDETEDERLSIGESVYFEVFNDDGKDGIIKFRNDGSNIIEAMIAGDIRGFRPKRYMSYLTKKDLQRYLNRDFNYVEEVDEDYVQNILLQEAENKPSDIIVVKFPYPEIADSPEQVTIIKKGNQVFDYNPINGDFKTIFFSLDYEGVELDVFLEDSVKLPLEKLSPETLQIIEVIKENESVNTIVDELQNKGLIKNYVELAKGGMMADGGAVKPKIYQVDNGWNFYYFFGDNEEQVLKYFNLEYPYDKDETDINITQVKGAELKHLKDSEEYDYILDARDIERYESGRYTPKGENYEYVNTFNRYDTNIPVPQEDFEKLVDAYHKQLSGDKLDIAKYDVLKQQMGNYLGHETINEMESYISKRHNSNKYAKGGEMAHGGGVPYKPYGKTKGRFKLTYEVEGEPQSEIRESLEEAMDSARRYVNTKLGYTNVHIYDENGKEYFFADGGETEDYYENLAVYVRGLGEIHRGNSMKEALAVANNYKRKNTKAKIVVVDDKIGDEYDLDGNLTGIQQRWYLWYAKGGETDGKYTEYEMVVLSKDADGKSHKYRFLISARNIDEAKQTATDGWHSEFGDMGETFYKVMSDSKYRINYGITDGGMMADGGEVDFIERMAKMRSAYENLNMIVKSKIAMVVGIDRAINIMENDYSIDPFNLITSAVRGGLLELDEINKDLVNEAVYEAENVTDDYRDSGQGISGSDMTAFTKNVLDSAGYKTGFINNRLERVDEEGNKLEIDKYNMNY
jgi:hypothetical protein